MKNECLEIVKKKCEKCQECGLGAARTNIVFADGNPETARVVLVGEAPGEMEDETGRPFVGRAGQLLNKFLANAGISRQNDLYIINTVKCRPPENRVPTDAEKNSCRKYLDAQISVIKPAAIILCGATALNSFIHVDKKTTISKIRGQWLTTTVDNVEYPAMTIFHPSYLLRNGSTAEGSPRWWMEHDLNEIKNAKLHKIATM